MSIAADAAAAHTRYVLKAARWQLIAVGALLGATMSAISHLSDAGPFTDVHLGLILGTVGIAVGAAFLLDDPAATTLAAVPATLRRRSLLRIGGVGVGVAAAALLVIFAVAWTRLDYLAAAVQTGVIVAVGVAGATVAGRLLGWRRPGVLGAAAIAALAVADGLTQDLVLLNGGAPGIEVSATVLAGLGVTAGVGIAWGTRDPLARRRRTSMPTTRKGRVR